MMRDQALAFVRKTIANQKAHMTRLSGYATIDRQYHKDIQTLLLWETILEEMVRRD